MRSAALSSSIGDSAPATTAGLLASVFPRLRYVRLVREDKVRQAISLWRAASSDVDSCSRRSSSICWVSLIVSAAGCCGDQVFTAFARSASALASRTIDDAWSRAIRPWNAATFVALSAGLVASACGAAQPCAARADGVGMTEA